MFFSDYVYIGNNVLIVADSVVAKSVASNVARGENPAKILCKIEDPIQRNMEYNTESKNMSATDKKVLLLSLPDASFIKKKTMEC